MAMMAKAGPSTSEIKGYMMIHVIEARDLAALDFFSKKSDPYAKLIYEGFQTPKQRVRTRVIDKTLNPVWKQSFFTWIFSESPTKMHVKVFDFDLGATDDFGGECFIDIPLEDGKVIDDWFPLHSRPGKNDKVSGDIHIKFEIFTIKRTTAVLWASPTYIMIDADFPNEMIEFQGDIPNELMSIFVVGVNLPAPYRIYDQKGNPMSWKMQIPRRGGLIGPNEVHRIMDRLQNYLIIIWNRLMEMGWFFSGKQSDNLLFLNEPSPMPWFAQPKNDFAKIPSGHVIIDQKPYNNTLDIQGEFDVETLNDLARIVTLNQISDKDGTFLKYTVEVSTSGMNGFSQKGYFRALQRYNNVFLNVLECLGRHGYIYVSDFNLEWTRQPHVEQFNHSFYFSYSDFRMKTHLLYRDHRTTWYAGNVGTPRYVLVDPKPWVWKISVMGNVQVEFLAGIFPKPKELKDKDGTHLSWMWKVREADKVVWSSTKMRRIENRFQNYMIRVFDALTHQGLRYMNDIGKRSLFVGHGPIPESSTHLLVDLQFRPKICIELQGEVNGTWLNEIAPHCNLGELHGVNDKDNIHLCWEIDVPTEIPTFPNHSDFLRAANTCQTYCLRTLNFLHAAGYEYATAQSNTHVLIRRRNLPAVPANYILIDIAHTSHGHLNLIAIELQGDVQQSHVNTLAIALDMQPQPLKVSWRNSENIGWSISVPGTEPTVDMTVRKERENRVQNAVLKILNLFYIWGWKVLDRADTSNGIYLIRYK